MLLYRYSYDMVAFRHKMAALVPLLISSAAVAAENSPSPLPAWSYGGLENGEDQWGMLSPAYAACETGTQQSPINIGPTEIADLPALQFYYKTSKMEIANPSEAFTLTPDNKQNVLTEGKHRYYLKRIELHSPGEHEVEDNFHLLEIQLVHEDAKKKVLIVSVFADFGEAFATLDPILAAVPTSGGSGKILLNPSSLLPKTHGYYAYTGSLTYPPCTEGVEWRILKQPLTITQAQWVALGKFTGRNSRLPQPIYMRTIMESR